MSDDKLKNYIKIFKYSEYTLIVLLIIIIGLVIALCSFQSTQSFSFKALFILLGIAAWGFFVDIALCLFLGIEIQVAVGSRK